MGYKKLQKTLKKIFETCITIPKLNTAKLKIIKNKVNWYQTLDSRYKHPVMCTLMYIL